MIDLRLHLVEELARQNCVCPEDYLSMLESTPDNRLIESLIPWAFLPDPKSSAEYCSRAVGYPVLPFAQAVGEDVVACFVARRDAEPGVIVINPWSDCESEVFQAELADFSEWVSYAALVSRKVMARDQRK